MRSASTQRAGIARIRQGAAIAEPSHRFYHHQTPRNRNNGNGPLFLGQTHQNNLSPLSWQIAQDPVDSSATIHLPSGLTPPNLPLKAPSRMPSSYKPALQRLFAANGVWADDVSKEYPTFFEESAKDQKPKLLWIGCADSRVPESILMAAKPGDIFVHRNIANQVHPHDDSVLSVIDYAVAHLGVEDIAVVGHSQCGGAKACLANATNPPGPNPNIPLMRFLEPLTDIARRIGATEMPKDVGLAKLTEANVKAQVGCHVAAPIHLLLHLADQVPFFLLYPFASRLRSNIFSQLISSRTLGARGRTSQCTDGSTSLRRDSSRTLACPLGSVANKLGIS
ncbi:hypothetical protein FRB95_004811 [Tulasnella sp. JGI-2019a]|nr:hypothetical protein FRB93_009615 [Tulasnella sp. JGI-2019a]KAG9037591.1 hypothetical protein FRB95_004811 [Tulasnella sp. JGI-2019a]